MTRTPLITGAVALTLAFSLTSAPAQARNLSLGQAVDKCTERAIEFGRKPYGRLADEPPAHKVQTQYRACVYANSGQYPSTRVKYRDSILTQLKDAFK